MFKKNILFILFLLPLFVFSQKIDRDYVYDTNEEIRLLERDGAFSEAYEKINRLISKLEKTEHLDYLSLSYQTKSGIESNLGEYEKSIETSRKALQICLKTKDSVNIAYNYNLIGIGYYFLSDYDSTKIYYEKSYNLKKRIKAGNKDLSISAYNLAILYEDLAQPEKALELYKDAEFFFLESKNEKTHSFLSDIYVGIAHVYFFRKDINKAEEYSEKAMDVGLKSYGEFNPNMTFVYTSYANILISKEKYKEAIVLYEKTLKIREDVYGENHKWTCESNYNLAEAYVLYKQYKKAEVLFKKAITIGNNINSSQYLAVAKAYLAKMYLDQDINFEISEKLLLDALEKNIAVFGFKNDIVAENYHLLARLAKKRDKKNAFFNYTSQTFKSAAYDKEGLNTVIAPLQVLDALVLMGDWYKSEYDKTKNVLFLKKKFLLIEQELDLIKVSQKSFFSDKSKINFANEYRTVFEKGLNTCWKLYHTTKDKKYLEKAFQLSETNRNTTLLNGLQDVKFKLLGDIPEDLLEKEKETKQALELVKLDLYYEKTAENPDKNFIGELLDKRILWSNKLDSLHTSFEKNYSRYNDLKYSNKVITLLDVQKSLDKNSQILIYFLGDTSLYTFTISNTKITFLKSEIAEMLTEKVKIFKTKLITQKNIKETSKALYLYLLDQQLNKTKQNLVIIPDNILSYIPFETLSNEKEMFLMNDFTISYSGSVRLFLELKNDFLKYKNLNYWVGFSPKYEQENTLSSNYEEVLTISDLVAGTSFIGGASKKSAFLENNKKYSILHLAMHAEIEEKNPMFNKLVFSDGELSASEIYLSNTKANLVVLSACNTGFGKLEKGEGVMNMARAFHFSGVSSVVMSLWKVPDKETKKIMVAFYKHLSKGETKNKALKNAKLDYLSSTKDIHLKHPYYWAGFVLNGNIDSLEQPKNYYSLMGGVGIGIVLLTLLFIIKKRKKSTF